jgi:hypothetical protein
MHRTFAPRCFGPLLLTAAALGCGSSSAAPAEAECSLQPPRLAAYRDFPGGGHGLWVRVGCQDGRLATPQEFDGTLLDAEPSESADVEIRQANPGPGLTVIAMRPGEGSTRRMRATVEALIEARPAAERIALYGWGQELVQLSDFRSSRPGLRKLLGRLDRVQRAAEAAPSADTLQTLLERAARTGGAAQRGMRSLVIISDEVLDVAGLPIGVGDDRAVEIVWAVPRPKGLGDAALRWNSDSDPETLAQALSDRLDAVAEHGFMHLAVCSDGDALSLALTSGSETEEVPLPKDLAADDVPACDLDELLKDRRAPVDRVTVTLDAEGEALYQARLAELERVATEYDLSTPLGQYRLITEGYGTGKDDFPVEVALSTGYASLAAEAHLRGQGAAFCPRPSLSVNLDDAARYFTADSRIDQFYLIAGCEDPGFYGYLGDTLYREHGIFPLELRFVELVLRGESQGAYAWIEQREQKLKTAHAALRGSVRRRYEPFVEPDVDSVIGHDEALRASYAALLGTGVADDDYAAYLDERLDVDAYLRWIALNSLLLNSDSLDESVFIASESIAEDGSATDYFDFMGWDPQALFVACDPSTGGLVIDAHGLTYCQASALDARVLGNAELYARYIDVLGEVLDAVDETRIMEIIDEARKQLEPLLEREGVAAAMNVGQELGANPWLGVTDAASAQAHLEALQAYTLVRFTARRAELREILDGL